MMKTQYSRCSYIPLPVSQIRQHSTSRVHRWSSFWGGLHVTPSNQPPMLSPERFQQTVINEYYEYIDTK
jgi:hypothetical protein